MHFPRAPLTPGGTRQDKGLNTQPPPMVPVLGPGAVGVSPSISRQEEFHPSILLYPASTNSASACRMGLRREIQEVAPAAFGKL